MSLKDSMKDSVKAAGVNSTDAVANVAEKVDPYPHYIMAGACFISSYFAQSRRNDMRTATITGLFGLAYAVSGYFIGSGNHKFGYQLGLATSVGLLAVTGPPALSTADPIFTSLASLSAVSTIGNAIKGYPEETKY